MTLENTILKEKLEIAESQIEDLIESYTNLQKQLSVDFQYQEIERLKSKLKVAVEALNEAAEWNGEAGYTAYKALKKIKGM